MKSYGFNKATEFSRKQISVIYFKAKSGALKIEKWFLNDMYNLSDYYGYDSNKSVEANERDVLNILNAVFANDFENAQKLIDEASDKWFSLYGKNNQAKCDRTLFVD